MKLFVAAFSAVSANIGCSIYPRGDIIGTNGQKFSDVLQYQPLNFKKCTNPVENDRFAEGTTCEEISCYGRNSHISGSLAVCACDSSGLECNWVQQENRAVSAVPSCPKGCRDNDIFDMWKCRKNFMWGDNKYMDNDGHGYYYPGERCKKVTCSASRQPKQMSGAGLAAWKLKAADFYECVCEGDNCSWSGLNDDVVEGTAFNAGIDLTCAEWTAWENVGSCVFGKQVRVRDCLVDETFYEAKNGPERDGRRGIAGYDCPGEQKEKTSC